MCINNFLSGIKVNESGIRNLSSFTIKTQYLSKFDKFENGAIGILFTEVVHVATR